MSSEMKLTVITGQLSHTRERKGLQHEHVHLQRCSHTTGMKTWEDSSERVKGRRYNSPPFWNEYRDGAAFVPLMVDLCEHSFPASVQALQMNSDFSVTPAAWSIFTLLFLILNVKETRLLIFVKVPRLLFKKCFLSPFYCKKKEGKCF